MRELVYCWVASLLLAFMVMPQQLWAQRQRVVVLTDLGVPNNPKDGDDIQSLVRLLVYSNDVDIEGLVATMAWKDTQDKTGVFPETIHAGIDAYAKVYGNLKKHDPDYPSPGHLHSLVKVGRDSKQKFWGGDHMKAVGPGMETEASKFIMDVLKRNDPRPVWFLGWGKMIDLAQAIVDIDAKASPEDAKKWLGRVRVYDIAGQDNGCAFIAKKHPEIPYLCSLDAFLGMGLGGDKSIIDEAWINANIRSNHGALGEFYPPAKAALATNEGDTPSLFHVLPNGIANPEDFNFGNWGGRFKREKSKNKSRKACAKSMEQFKDYFFYIEEGGPEAVFKWRPDYQNDFAARMDWCVKPVSEANHNPVAVVNGLGGHGYVQLPIHQGAAVEIDASGSSDPDKGDTLSFKWTMPIKGHDKFLKLETPAMSKIRVNLTGKPSDSKLHILLEVSDSGKPRLKSWRRIVLTVDRS